MSASENWTITMIELPGVIESGMPGRNGQRKPGTTRGSPRRSRTAKALRISRPTLHGGASARNRPDTERDIRGYDGMHEGRKQTNTWSAYAGSRLELSDALGRRRPKRHPSSRTGENPPYGMIGGIEETSASFEARSAPRSYPTAGLRLVSAWNS